jgi:hypothetical protein
VVADHRNLEGSATPSRIDECGRQEGDDHRPLRGLGAEFRQSHAPRDLEEQPAAERNADRPVNEGINGGGHQARPHASKTKAVLYIISDA